MTAGAAGEGVPNEGLSPVTPDVSNEGLSPVTKAGNDAPIGVFDSGLGGLTVLREIHRLLPCENLVYFGDSGRTPYGTKSQETVLRYTLQDVNFLLSKGVKAIVIACNTASACSLDTVRQTYGLPVIEVVEPGSAAAVAATKTGRIGVIGTPATIGSEVYKRAIDRAASAAGRTDVNYFGVPCPLFVSLAEEGWWDNDVARLTARKYLEPLKDAGIDTLVLGCTHYPLLTPAISRVMGRRVKLINSASVVAAAVQNVLRERGLLRCAENADNATVRFFTSDSADKFRALGSKFLAGSVEHVERVDIEQF
ncbi:MAG: glutamate racemase [Clostridia bacterium]|nr:glutamate racemase [Clostridia bacterium]